ncbi:RDD family protein [Nocardioides sp.]|uniref:RDD family protein n=1 Tax=Nocardioides sp. TaxID=35761 RepID=UPI0026097C64|nr:RDD family protein [Nocardioides sp.]
MSAVAARTPQAGRTTPAARSALAAPDASPGGLEPRLHAFAVDRLVDLGVPLALGGVLAATGQGAGVVVGAVLAAVLVLLLALAGLLGTRGTSPGLALTGLRLVRVDDLAPVGFGPALKRQTVLLLAGAPTFGIGWATLAWTAVADPEGQRRGWHDQLADSLVVDPSPAPVAEVAPELPQQIVNLTAMRLAPPEPAPVRGRPARSGPAVPAPGVHPAPGTPAPPAAAPAPPAGAAASAATPAPEAPAAVRRPGRRRAGVPTSAEAPRPVTPAPPTRATPAQHVRPDAAVPAPAASGPSGASGASGWTVRLDTGEELPVDGLTLLGRGPQARAGESVSRLVPLQSGDMSVSKTHAQLQLADDGTLVAMDRGSTNGSVVVRRGVPRHLSPGRPTTLLDGDVLRLGDRTLQVSRRA